MNVWKKLSALTFVLALALALSVSAFASEPATLTNGKVGSANADGTVPTSLSDIVNLKKDLIVYNATNHVTGEGTSATADEKVYAPQFSYTYTVTAATVPTTAYTVTDANGTVAPVKAGILKGLKVGDDPNAVAATGNTDPVTGTLSFTTSEALKANSSGATNTYDIPLDFTRVNFIEGDAGDGAQGAGVYRYKIVEALTGSPSAPAYSTLSMVDGGMNTVYLDVYVKGNGDIYGYVCLPGNDSDNSGNISVVAKSTETTKVDGFVYSETDNQNGADMYYTYDLTLSKTVENDNYATSHTAFPFTVFFKKDPTMTAKFKMVETIAQASTTDTDTVGFTGGTVTESANGWNVVAKIKSGASITYSGIPCGMDVDVYETNSMDGVTYKVTTKTTKVNAAADATETDKYNTNVDNAVTSTTAPSAASEQGDTKDASQSTKASFDTTLATEVKILQSCNILNALINISPTGVTLRYAPYLLTLGAGVTVLPLTRRYKKREEDLV